ncbi:hypothetical protein F6Q10_22135, partial [Streptomyces vinaceus]|nr:hypothetical protein [Streptomyces vinaceus]
DGPAGRGPPAPGTTRPRRTARGRRGERVVAPCFLLADDDRGRGPTRRVAVRAGVLGVVLCAGAAPGSVAVPGAVSSPRAGGTGC